MIFDDILDSLYRSMILNTTEISLNGAMVLNDTEWYSMVFSCIPLALFCTGCVCNQTNSQ